MNKIPSGYKEVKLGDIVDITMGQSPKSEFYNKRNEGMPFLQGSATFGFMHPYFETYSSDIKKIAVNGSVLMSVRVPVGDLNIANADVCIGRGLCSINGKSNIINRYIFYLLSYYKPKLLNMQKGTTFGAITKDDILNFKVLIAEDIEEQKRIASALSKIDAYLENTIKLIEEKERFKRGIAKKLLTCKEGENIPEARFKGFEDEWEIVKLGDICLINNKSLKENTDKDYKFKYIDLTAVKKGIINFSNDYTTFENAPISARRIINKNDIIMATVRPYLLGHAFIDFEVKDYICSKGFAVLTANSNIEMKYIYQYLYSDDMAKQIKSRLVGSTYPTIRLSDIKELKIKIPKSIKEQEKIGVYLSLLDAEIDNLKKQKELIKEMKRGAMQKLLSGEVRLLE